MTLGGFGSHPCRLVSISYGSTLYCHGRGREFESRRPRHILKQLRSIGNRYTIATLVFGQRASGLENKADGYRVTPKRRYNDSDQTTGSEIRSLVLFGYGSAARRRRFCGLCSNILSSRHVPRTVAQSHYSPSRRSVFYLDRAVRHADSVSLSATCGLAPPSWSRGVHVGVLNDCPWRTRCLGCSGTRSTAVSRPEVFLYRPTRRHGHLRHADFLRLPQSHESSRSQAPASHCYGRIVGRRY